MVRAERSILPTSNIRRETAADADANLLPRSPSVRARHTHGGSFGGGSSGGGSGLLPEDMSVQLAAAHTHHSGDRANRLNDGDSQDEESTPPRQPSGWLATVPQLMQREALTVWGAGAATAAALLLQRLDGEAATLWYLYYQPLVPVAAMLWAWAAAVAFFEARAIRYDVCFSARDQNKLLPARALYHIAGLVTAIVATSAALFAWLCWREQHHLAAWQPPAVYSALALLLFLPLNMAYKDTRHFFGATLARVASPFREVSWADFLLADFLTSLAKPLSDGERALCHLLTGPIMDPSPRACSGASWLVPAAWAAPFAWRFCQCIRVWHDTGATPQLWNALKYSTAFPLIGLSAAKASVTPAEWLSIYRPLWIAACTLNSSYSYFWDVERDWEIAWFTAPRGSGERWWLGLPKPVMRDHLFFGPGLYHWLLTSNAVLRLAWLHKLVPRLRRSPGAVLGFVLLEVFRRAQWAPVRIEVELRKLQTTRPELGRLVPPASGSHGHGHSHGGSGSHSYQPLQRMSSAGSSGKLPPIRTAASAAIDCDRNWQMQGASP